MTKLDSAGAPKATRTDIVSVIEVPIASKRESPGDTGSGIARTRELPVHGNCPETGIARKREAPGKTHAARIISKNVWINRRSLGINW